MATISKYVCMEFLYMYKGGVNECSQIYIYIYIYMCVCV